MAFFSKYFQYNNKNQVIVTEISQDGKIFEGKITNLRTKQSKTYNGSLANIEGKTKKNINKI